MIDLVRARTLYLSDPFANYYRGRDRDGDMDVSLNPANLVED